MLITSLALAAALLAAPAPLHSPPPLVCASQGEVDWFEGSLDEALVKAVSSGRVVVLEFRADSCKSCARLDREVLSTPSVVTELEALICLRIDGESEPGRRLVERFGVPGFPMFLFFDPDGSPRDGISGYRPTNLFRAELQRIRSGEGTIPHRLREIAAAPEDPRPRLDLIPKLQLFGARERVEAEKKTVADLIDRGVGFDPNSAEDRWRLCVRLREIGMKERAAQQVAAIARLDPPGETVPGRWVILERAIVSLKVQGDDSTLRAFLAAETEPELLYAGWRKIQGFCRWKTSRAKNDEESRRRRAQWRLASRQVWDNVPEAERAYRANNIAWGFYEDDALLTDEERRFALELAEIAVELAPEEVNTIDTYACCLFINGERGRALEQVRRCIELDPRNELWRRRLVKLSQGEQAVTDR